MRLLPKNRDLDGWTPYAWLIYLLFFALAPFAMRAPARDQVLGLLGALAGVPLYFWGYWQTGKRTLWAVGGFLLLGTFFAHSNPAASVFVVYGACYLGKLGSPGVAFAYLGGLLALVGFESWILRFPPEYWLSGLIFGALMGSVTIHHEQRRILTSKLLQAREEADHLAKVAERERIARDLHDLLGHTLSVIILKSELASRLATAQPRSVRPKRFATWSASRARPWHRYGPRCAATAPRVSKANSARRARPWKPPASRSKVRCSRRHCPRCRRASSRWLSAKPSPMWCATRRRRSAG